MAQQALKKQGPGDTGPKLSINHSLQKMEKLFHPSRQEWAVLRLLLISQWFRGQKRIKIQGSGQEKGFFNRASARSSKVQISKKIITVLCQDDHYF